MPTNLLYRTILIQSGDLDYALLQLEQGPDEEKFVEEVLSNV